MEHFIKPNIYAYIQKNIFQTIFTTTEISDCIFNIKKRRTTTLGIYTFEFGIHSAVTENINYKCIHYYNRQNYCQIIEFSKWLQIYRHRI